MNLSDQVFQYVGQLVFIGGGGAAVAYALFQYLGKSWIESRFAERLEAFKHQQALELQRLRVQIESMLNGALKLQELEFTVLPEAWKKLDAAYGLTRWITASLQQYPSLEGLTDAELEETLSNSKLLESQRAKVRAARAGRDRDKIYQDLIRWQRLNRARKAAVDLETYVVGNGLFLPPTLKQQFSEITPVIWSAITMAESSLQFEDHKMRSAAAEELQSNAEPLHKAIEKGIEERLHSHARHE
jgi:hypothetical protein